METLQILERFDLYRSAQPDIQREMREGARLVSLPRGAMYLCDGDQSEVIALVGEGRLRVFKTSESGREITLYGVGPGEFCLLNLLCVLTGIPAPASALVEDPVRAIAFGGDQFRRWIGADPAMRTQMFALLGQSVAGIMALVEEIAFKKMDVRLAEYLDARLDSGILEATHEMIAADLGSAREVISRLLKEFERQGAVELGRGRIILADERVLHSLAAKG